jgi:hypothetical protein
MFKIVLRILTGSGALVFALVSSVCPIAAEPALPSLARLKYALEGNDKAGLKQSSTARLPQAKLKTHWYGHAEYLLWWVKAAPLAVPLVSTGPTSSHHGSLDSANSTILYGAPFAPAAGGNNQQNFPAFSGGRFTLGYWIDDARRFAIEASGFVLESQTAGYAIRSDAGGNPLLGIPMYNNTIPSATGVSGKEDSLPFALNNAAGQIEPGVIKGGIVIDNTLRLWGAELTQVFSVYRTPNWEVYGVTGFRHLNLAESFTLFSDIQGVSGNFTGMSGTVHDLFETRNHFYGGLLGLRARYMHGPWSAEVTGRVAIGLSHEVINITGGYTSVNFTAPFASGPEGVFAQPANEGTTSANKFAVVPEVAVKVGYALTPSIRIVAGYDFLYYSDVVRPTDQINRSIPKGQTFQQDGQVASTTNPSRLFNTTNFYAQGLNVGLAISF